MYATLDGQPVTDLEADEIQVLEDDVPQTIEAFEHVQVRSAGPQEARVEPKGIADSRQMAQDARARVFVVFLDTYHTTIEGSGSMRLPLVRFLDRVLGPDDLVALMTPEMAASDISFGRKTTVISNIMQTEWSWGRRGRLVDNDPKDELYDACGAALGLDQQIVAEMKARRRERLTLDALEDLVVHLGGVREERKAVLTVTEGWVLFRQNLKLADTVGAAGPARPPAFRPPVPPPAETGTVSQPMQIECEADRRALALVDHDFRLREVADEANRGNVTFYPVYARGLVVFDADIGPDRPPRGDVDAGNLRTRHESLRFLADTTDGSAVINTNNVDAALKRITDDLSSYYLLGYYSTNTQLDGRFRSITVRVKRPGVRVRARRGYRGRTAEDVLNGAGGPAETPEASAITSALNAVASVNARSAFRIRTSSWARAGADGNTLGSFWVVGELDFRTRRELAWTAGAQAQVVVVAADGRQVESRTVNVRAGDGAFDVRVPESGTLPAGEYAVRVRLQPDGDPGLALTDLARVIVNSTATPFGDAVLWRRGRSTGPRFLRTADPRFQRSDRLRLELPAPSAATAGEITARMLDRAGSPLSIPLQVTVRAEPGGEMSWIVVDAALAPMAPGDYAVEVSRGDDRQVTAFRVVP
jgi:VWFA-related protein